MMSGNNKNVGTNSRIKNSVITMITGGLRQFLAIILTFVSRTVFINILGAEYLGLNGLFSNILQILSLSELGIGTAISFYLYKPVAEHDTERIKSVMRFYKLCYRGVGFSMIGIGCLIMPLMPYVVNFETELPVNLYIVYFLYVLNIASSYLLFAYKQAIITANQELYKIERINIVFTFFNCLIDILILIIAHDYIAYLVSKFIMVLVKNIVISLQVDKEYPYIKEQNVCSLPKNEIKNFFGDMGNVALFRIGSTLFNSTDNIIISYLLGTTIVGYYSNYYMVISQVSILIGLMVGSVSASVGNVIAKENQHKQYQIFRELDFIVTGVMTVFTACLFQTLNSFIALWLGSKSDNYILSQTVVAFLCMSFYMDGTTQIPNTFREASGHFEIGKSLQVIGGLVNIVLSLLMGEFWGLEGIFAATVISKFFVTVFPFIMNIGDKVFQRSRGELLSYYLQHAGVTAFITAFLWIVGQCVHKTTTLGFVLEICLSIAISLIVYCVIYGRTTEMKALIVRMKGHVGLR